MRFKTFKVLPIIILEVVVFINVLAAEDIKKVKELEFRGIEKISKYDLLKKVRLKVEGESIIIDIDSLRKVLEDHSLIDKYKIEIGGRRVVITINEKKIFMTIAVKKGTRIIPFEVDGNFEIIAGGKLYSKARPVIIFSGKFISDSRISAAVKRICRFINSLKFKQKEIYREISEVHIVKSDLIRLFLLGRPTQFELRPDEDSFLKLKNITAYLDKIEFYPDKILIMENVALVRN